MNSTSQDWQDLENKMKHLDKLLTAYNGGVSLEKLESAHMYHIYTGDDIGTIYVHIKPEGDLYTMYLVGNFQVIDTLTKMSDIKFQHTMTPLEIYFSFLTIKRNFLMLYL